MENKKIFFLVILFCGYNMVYLSESPLNEENFDFHMKMFCIEFNEEKEREEIDQEELENCFPLNTTYLDIQEEKRLVSLKVVCSRFFSIAHLIKRKDAY
ncbi:hypothetical protein HYV11_01065 [Candidatus Dependentiae bacterium]|nr:hypothetical protein [Candidatus Dependentiae bacterium]